MSQRLAQLDRWLARNGEEITLRRYSGLGPMRTSTGDLTLLAKVKGMTAEQLVGSISQQSYLIIMSPTPILADGWPHQSTTQPSLLIDPSSDAQLPTTSDKVFVHFKERAITRAVAVYEDGECQRIELTATG